MEFKKQKAREITIRSTVNGGFIVKCGCAELAYSNPKRLAKDLLDYLDNPEKMESEYNKSKGEPTGVGFAGSMLSPFSTIRTTAS